MSPATQNDENLTESCTFDMFFLCCPSLPTRYNLACHRLETLLQNIDLPPLNSANNAQYFLRKPDKVVEEDQRVFSAYQDCIQLQLQLNLAHHAVQRLRVSLGANRKSLPTGNAPESQELVHNSSTEQLRTIIRYLLDTLLSLLHSNNGKNSAERKSQDTGGFKMQELTAVIKDIIFLCSPPKATQCPPCCRVHSTLRPVRSCSNTCASVGHQRSVCMLVCCWCSCVEASAGGDSSSPMCCRSSTILSSCSFSLRTGRLITATPALKRSFGTPLAFVMDCIALDYRDVKLWPAV